MPDTVPRIPRTPPRAVRRALTAEVGFQCPFADCMSPYLTFHHFDPPWREEQHHRVEGMIALCAEHAAKADGDHYPSEYLADLKSHARDEPPTVSGEFDFLRHDLVAVVGSNAYFQVGTLVEVNGEPVVYMRPDSLGYQRLSFKLPGPSGAPRAWMEDNVWLVPPDAKYIDCPPRGRSLKVAFENGDHFRVEFRDFTSSEQLVRAFPMTAGLVSDVTFPVTVAEFWERSVGASFEFGRGSTSIGSNTIQNSSMVRCAIGLAINGYSQANEIAINPTLRAQLQRTLEKSNAVVRKRRAHRRSPGA